MTDAMNDIRPLASLSAGLLARKGDRALNRRPVALPPLHALPAALLETLEQGVDDAPLVAPMVATVDAADLSTADAAAALGVDPLYRPLPQTSGGRRRKDLTAGAKAAFTLRLDATRHLKLRLACALASRSAQGVVLDALDRLLAADPLIELLAQQGNDQ